MTTQAMNGPDPAAAHGSTPMCKGRRRDGQPCGNPAGKGTDHVGSGNCKYHCGSTPNGRKAALAEQAERLLYRYDAAPAANPLEALQALAGRVLAMEQAIGDAVNNLGSIRYGTDEGGEQLRAEVSVLERAMDRAGRLLTDIARLNIDERLAKIEEAKAKVIVEAVEVALAAAGIRGQAAVEPKRAAARHLRAAS